MESSGAGQISVMRAALTILAVLGSATATAIFSWALWRAFGHMLRDAPPIERLVMIVGCSGPALAGVLLGLTKASERTAVAVIVLATVLGIGAAIAVAVRGQNRQHDRRASTAGRR